MGASSSGLLDGAKINNIKGLVDSTFQSFSVFYRQQYSAAYTVHLHQEVEPKKEGRGLLLAHGPQYAPEEVLYQGSVKLSCWYEQGKKCKERFIVLRREYKVEIHENAETFSRGCAAKLVLQPAGGSVFTKEEESKAHLERTCAGILNGVKEDSSSVVSSPDVLAVYLHLPYMGHTCFLFQQEEERDNFLSAIKTCIRHGNLDPWCDSSYESQAFVRALRLYRQDRGSYESWEMLLGTEEQVLASQVMEEVLSWLQSQLQSRVKGKKAERIRQWLATVQASYSLVLEQLSFSLEALRAECRQTASANQALIRSNLDQIMSSHCFLEEKVKACICAEAEKVCGECVSPNISSILEALTEHISAGIQGMQHTLHTQMDSAFTNTNGGTEETKKDLSALHSIRLDQSYRQVESLTEKLEDVKQRFGLSSTQRLVHCAQLQMEKLLDSAVYTLDLFLLSSARLQPSLIPVKMPRATERVLKQLDYDSRVVQRRLYQDAVLQITLPTLSRNMDSKWKRELQQFEQFIFSDYSNFILVQNVYDDVLRNILSKEIETAVQEAAGKRSRLLLDTSDLTISQYSLLGPTPPRSAPGSPATATRDPPSAEPSAGGEGGETVPAEVPPQSDPDPSSGPESTGEARGGTQPDPDAPSETAGSAPTTPDVAVRQEVGSAATAGPGDPTPECPDPPMSTLSTDVPAECAQSAASGNPPPPDLPTVDGETEDPPTQEVDASDAAADSWDPTPDCPDPPMSTLSSLQSTDVPADQSAAPESSPPPDLSPSGGETEGPPAQDPHPQSAPCLDCPMEISLGSLREAISCSSTPQTLSHTDRAVYLTGGRKDSWEEERVREGGEEKGREERIQDGKEESEAGGGEEEEGRVEGEAKSGGESVDEGEKSSEPAEGATEQAERGGEDGEEREMEERKEDQERAEEEGEQAGKEGEKENEEEEEVLQSPQPMGAQCESVAELPLDSVAIIRDLVTEITEVETVISPRPNSGHTA
ncbi:protein Niban 1-like [Gymnodraco acuticeps]|uniref:Protein Niban 1-like n=1 Tax=Gymnodraco acuticeps TaxID=8218 RepID=A0A6P8U3T6_GYMAC|nr:protein Niban 1-like [Gymnodraco acuticeps]